MKNKAQKTIDQANTHNNNNNRTDKNLCSLPIYQKTTHPGQVPKRQRIKQAMTHTHTHKTQKHAMTIRFHLFDSYFKTKTNRAHCPSAQSRTQNLGQLTHSAFPVKTAMAVWQHCRLSRVDWSLRQWRRRGCHLRAKVGWGGQPLKRCSESNRF